MGVRLKAEFHSDQNNLYKIEIHDSSWAPAAYTFNVDSTGFQISYNGETSDIVSPVVGSNVTINAYNESTQFDAFISDLTLHQEDRFRIVIYKGSDLYWAGWILQDLIRVEDSSKPYVYSITASDGFAKISNTDYDNANTETQANGITVTRLNEIILNALVDTGLSDLWGTSDKFLEIAVDWWETTSHTYATTTDPMYLTGVDVSVLQTKDDSGVITYMSGLDVLKQLATLFNARIYQANGRFIFEQYGVRASTSRYIHTYTKAGVEVSDDTISDEVTLDQTIAGGARLAGNEFNYLPAMKRAEVTYAQRFLSPWFSGYTYDTTNTSHSPGFMSSGAGISLLVYGPLSYELTDTNRSSANDTTAYAPVYKVQIKIEDGSNPGTYHYYSNAYTNGYPSQSPIWSTTAGYFYLTTPMVNVVEGYAAINASVHVATTDIPVSGVVTVSIELHDRWDYNGGAAYTLASGQADTWSLPTIFSRANHGIQAADGVVYSSTNSSSVIASGTTLDLGSVIISDGFYSTGGLAVYNGTAWVAALAWRKGSTGTGKTILNLLTTEALALHYSPIKQYEGTIVTDANFQPRIGFDSENYLRTGGSFNANEEEWQSQYFLISRDTTTIGDLDPVTGDLKPTTAGMGTTGDTNTPIDLTGGRIGGMGIDLDLEKIGPFQQVTGGAKIIGALKDGEGSFGSSGQVLSSTVSGLSWITSASTNDYVTGMTFNTADGILTLTRSGGLGDITQDLDGRYLTQHPTIINSGSTSNANGVVVQSVTIDSNGHSTGWGTVDLDTRFLQLSGGTLTGALIGTTSTFSGIVTAVGGNSTEWNSAYDNSLIHHLPLAGGTMSGDIDMDGSRILNGVFATASGTAGQFVKGNGSLDSTAYLSLAGGTMTGALTVSDKIHGVTAGTANTDAVNVQQLNNATTGVLTYQGIWNASTNTPTLTSATGTIGGYYIVSVDGTTDLDGITDWKVGDWAVFSDMPTDAWQKIDNTSILGGAGTGGSLAAWTGSGTSLTLGDAPVTYSGNDVTTAGFVRLGGGNYFETATNVFKAIAGQNGAYLRSAISSAANPSYANVDDYDTGMFLPGANVLGLTTGGVERLRIDSSGNATFAGTIGSGAITSTGVITATGGNSTTWNTHTTNTGTVTSVETAGTVSGITLTGTVTTSGILSLGGTLALTSANVTDGLGFTPAPATGGSYLPLAGGTLTGTLNINAGATAIGKIYNSSGALAIQGNSTRDVSLGSDTSPNAIFIEGTNGSVGIGTVVPTSPLHISGDFGTSDPYATLMVDSTVNHGGVVMNAVTGKQTHIRFLENNVKQWQIRKPPGVDELRVYSWTAGSDVLTLNSSGNATFAGTIGASNLSGTNTGDQDLSTYAPLASPTFTGSPRSVTPVTSSNDFSIATTAYVKAQGYSTTSGTVTSVAMTVPTGLSVSGTPITTSGTLAVVFASGYSIPTNTGQANWNTAYTYSQVGHLPLAGGTLTGALVGTSAVFTGAAGIGMSGLPARELEVTGAGNVYVRLTAKLDTDSTAIELKNTKETWQIRNEDQNDDALQFQSDTLTALTIQKTGNIGVGNTSPDAKLHVSTGVSGASVNGNADELIVSSDGNAGMSILTPNTAIGRLNFGDPEDNDSGKILYNHSTNKLQFYTSGGLAVDIDSAGAIKFSSYDSTSNTGTPTYLLGTDASGNVVKTNTVPGSADGPYLPLSGGTLTGALTGTTSTFTGIVTALSGTSTEWNTAYGWGDHTGLYLRLAGDAMSGDIEMDGHTVNDGVFVTRGGASSDFLMGDGTLDSTEYLALTGGTLTGGLVGTTATLSGDVAIGSTTANTKLTINAASASASVMAINLVGGPDVTDKAISIGRHHSVSNYYIESRIDFGAEIGGNGRSYLGFVTGNQGTGLLGNTEKMRLTSDGDVAIGHSSAAAKLDVNGGIRMADDATAASATNVGTQRYRTSGSNSYVDMCMQTGASSYAWVNILENNW